jgi:hypothetical protein
MRRGPTKKKPTALWIKNLKIKINKKRQPTALFFSRKVADTGRTRWGMVFLAL